MKNKCRKCGKTLTIPSWVTCRECDAVKPEKPKRNMQKYLDDNETIEELQRRSPAQKKKNI